MRRNAGRPPRLAAPLLLMAFAIACYVASEVGVSSWLVRYLEPAPLSVATLALTLYWLGIAIGRLLSSMLADRFDHRRFTLACAAGLAFALVAAILVPSLPLSIAFFALAGVASGPIFPMIIAIGGERYRDRSTAVSGFLGGTGVIGSIVYPSVMGFMSVTVGLTVAMLGNAVLALACAVALVLVGGRPQVQTGLSILPWSLDTGVVSYGTNGLSRLDKPLSMSGWSRPGPGGRFGGRRRSRSQEQAQRRRRRR